MHRTNQFDQITGIETLRVPDNKVWERNLGIVRALCVRADNVTGWFTDDAGGRNFRIPQEYEINGMKVEFLPNWDHYKIDGSTLALPNNPQIPPDSYTKQLVLDLKNMQERSRHIPPRRETPAAVGYNEPIGGVPASYLRRRAIAGA